MGNNKDRYKRSYPIFWDQLHRDAKALSWRLHDRETLWKGIVAITRGGACAGRYHRKGAWDSPH